ncbi:MAG: hypothetical protein WDM76_01650 [Limisphaerales bacterium]
MKMQKITTLGASLLLFFSVKAAHSADTPSADGPSEKETIEWIQAHLAQLKFSYSRTFNSGSSSDSSGVVSSVDLKNSQIVFVEEYGDSGHSSDYSFNHYTDNASKYTVTVSDLLGGVEIIKTELSASGVTFSPSTRTELRFTAKPDKVKISSSSYSSYDNDSLGRLDGTEVKALEKPAEEVKRRAINNQGKQSTASQFKIPVDPTQGHIGRFFCLVNKAP